MKKKIVAGVVALSMMAGLALVAGSASAAANTAVEHKGRVICVNDHAVQAHLDHGDVLAEAKCKQKKKIKK